MHIRLARAEDHNQLLEVWERSARATHHFLTDVDVQTLRPMVAEEFVSETIQWWVLASDEDFVIGFLGFTTGTIEGLFIDPAFHGKGGGKMLIAHAQTLTGDGALSVDVNEQNEAAVGFYNSLGFSVVGQSPTDGAGRQFPMLHMQRARPSARGAV